MFFRGNKVEINCSTFRKWLAKNGRHLAPREKRRVEANDIRQKKSQSTNKWTNTEAYLGSSKVFRPLQIPKPWCGDISKERQPRQMFLYYE